MIPEVLTTIPFEDYVGVTVALRNAAVLLTGIFLIRFMMFCKVPKIKASVLELVLIVPIYAVCAQASFEYADRPFLPEAFTLLRELYEAVVISAFLSLVLTVLGGPTAAARAFQAEFQEPQVPCATWFPRSCGCCARVPMPLKPGDSLVASLLKCILQLAGVCAAYFVVCVAIFLACLVAWAPEMLTDGLKLPLLLKLTSVTLAVQSTIMLLAELERNDQLKDRVAKIRPHLKFWTVKMFIVLPVLQKAVVENYLPQTGLLDQIGGARWTPAAVGIAMQSFLLCVEAVLFSILIFLAFDVSDFDEIATAGEDSLELFSILHVFSMVREMSRAAKLNRRRLKGFILVGSDQEVAYLFRRIGAGGSGELSYKEFVYVLRMAGLSHALGRDLFHFADVDKSGTITMEEFRELVRQLRKPKRPVKGLTSLLGTETWWSRLLRGDFFAGADESPVARLMSGDGIYRPLPTGDEPEFAERRGADTGDAAVQGRASLEGDRPPKAGDGPEFAERPGSQGHQQPNGGGPGGGGREHRQQGGSPQQPGGGSLRRPGGGGQEHRQQGGSPQQPGGGSLRQHTGGVLAPPRTVPQPPRYAAGVPPPPQSAVRAAAAGAAAAGRAAVIPGAGAATTTRAATTRRVVYVPSQYQACVPPATATAGTSQRGRPV